MDISKKLEGMFGELKFYAALDKKLFAEVKIEDEEIEIRIINIIVTIEAMLIHVFKKHRVSSNKLHELKKAGFKIVIRLGKLRFGV
ncbi:MAG: hypothetical protein DRO99_04880 [Candidatus Aenigmatarchaeota archaeon]|nr:MAG: hypothetical protein DRO99_04880 [Candidatus Aenigmarchaeota archaeon]